jgi:transposase-like protein
MRRVLYTPKALESVHYTLRKRLNTRGVVPHDAAMVQVWYGARHQGAQKWPPPLRAWNAALNQCVSLLGERVRRGKKVTQCS